jgi:hypothetical protein
LLFSTVDGPVGECPPPASPPYRSCIDINLCSRCLNAKKPEEIFQKGQTPKSDTGLRGGPAAFPGLPLSPAVILPRNAAQLGLDVGAKVHASAAPSHEPGLVGFALTPSEAAGGVAGP